MAEYIEREAAVSFIRENQCKKCSDIGLCGNCAVLTAIMLFESVPAADVAPVRRGKWMRTNCSPHRIYCSECYGTFIPDDEVTRLKDVPHRFCPKCGASMEERG